MVKRKSVLVAGATGLVGGECVRQLARDPDVAEVRALVRRRPPPDAFPADVRLIVTDFEALADHADSLAADHVFCALGTTIRKAGSQAAFRKIDYEYPLAIARLAFDRGASHFLLVSSIGADADSRVFYSRTKGQLERAIIGLGYRAVTIVRPSFLLGDRTEPRHAESIGRWLARFAPARWRSVHARDVAGALVAASRADAPGSHVIENRELLQSHDRR